MEHLLTYIGTLSLATRLALTIVGLLLVRGMVGLLESTVSARLGHADRRYRVRKILATAAYITVLLFIAMLFADRLKEFGPAVGFVGAGLVVALQDIIISIGGFLAITFSSLYRVGDRIQVNETKGDVVDISVMRTTLMEIGNWVTGDIYNGRIVRIPNSTVLKGLVFNYSQGFRFVWDEINVRFKAGSNQSQAREMLLRIGRDAISDYLVEAHEGWRHMNENYVVETPLLEPTVALQATSGTLEFCLRYIVDYTRRTVVRDALFTRIVDEVANSRGELEWAPSCSTTVLLRPEPPDFPDPIKLVSHTGTTAER